MSIRNQTWVFLTSLALDVSAEARTRALHIVHPPIINPYYLRVPQLESRLPCNNHRYSHTCKYISQIIALLACILLLLLQEVFHFVTYVTIVFRHFSFTFLTAPSNINCTGSQRPCAGNQPHSRRHYWPPGHGLVAKCGRHPSPDQPHLHFLPHRIINLQWFPTRLHHLPLYCYCKYSFDKLKLSYLVFPLHTVYYIAS